MKRTTILRAICVAFLSAAMSAPMAQVGTTLKSPVVGATSQGSVVAVKGIASNLRLPKAAGRVSKVGPAGPLVPSAPTTTFVAQGDKRVSLCYLNKAATVTCTPVVPTVTLEGIDVSYFHKNGYTLVRFSPVTPSSTTAAAKTLIKTPTKVPNVAHAARAFMAGLNKAAVVLEHHAARHIGDQAMPTVVDAGGSGGVCTFDDSGGLSCSGGGGGGDDGGGGGDPVPGGCWDCNYPGDPDPVLPPNEGTTPATNANEPCTVVDGSTVCVMTGPRPLPVPAPTVPPIGDIPPVGGIPPIDQLPSGPRPWLPPIDWCSLLGVGCPPVMPSEAYGSPEWYAGAVANCKREANAKYNACHALAEFRPSGLADCISKADKSYEACLQEAEDATRRYRP